MINHEILDTEDKSSVVLKGYISLHYITHPSTAAKEMLSKEST